MQKSRRTSITNGEADETQDSVIPENDESDVDERGEDSRDQVHETTLMTMHNDYIA